MSQVETPAPVTLPGSEGERTEPTTPTISDADAIRKVAECLKHSREWLGRGVDIIRAHKLPLTLINAFADQDEELRMSVVALADRARQAEVDARLRERAKV